MMLQDVRILQLPLKTYDPFRRGSHCSELSCQEDGWLVPAPHPGRREAVI